MSDAPAKAAFDPSFRPAAQHLFAARTVLVFGEVTPDLAAQVTTDLLALAALSRAPIRLVLNSPGGHVESGDTIHDVIRFIEPEVSILGTGWVASAGALIFSAAARERRFCLPNTRFLLHEPSGGMSGQASDVEIEARQVLRMRERLIRIFADASGQSVERVTHDMRRNHWLSAEEARTYGLVGRVIERASEFVAA